LNIMRKMILMAYTTKYVVYQNAFFNVSLADLDFIDQRILGIKKNN
jgi:hypothetical protein